MPSYSVDLQTKEENEESFSITGTVNGKQTATVVSKLRMPRLKDKELDPYLRKQLALAYAKTPPPKASAATPTVSLSEDDISG